MNFSVPQKLQLQSFRQLLSVTGIPLTGRPKDNGTRLPYSIILLWDPAFKFQRLVWSEAAYHFLTALSFQNSTLSCSCRQYGNHRSIPSNAKSSIFLRNKSTLKMRTLEVIKRMMLASQRPVGTCLSLWRPKHTTRTWSRYKEEAWQWVF